MSGCVTMAVRDAMSVAHRQWARGNQVVRRAPVDLRGDARADYCRGTRKSSCVSGCSLVFCLCNGDVLRVWSYGTMLLVAEDGLGGQRISRGSRVLGTVHVADDGTAAVQECSDRCM